ncbi:MAG: hypothetical protein K9H84_08525 [Bacteroidales bacterium]|nr:hypothetical protein [Bacteroidales bacterium]
MAFNDLFIQKFSSARLAKQMGLNGQSHIIIPDLLTILEITKVGTN